MTLSFVIAVAWALLAVLVKEALAVVVARTLFVVVIVSIIILAGTRVSERLAPHGQLALIAIGDVVATTLGVVLSCAKLWTLGANTAIGSLAQAVLLQAVLLNVAVLVVFTLLLALSLLRKHLRDNCADGAERSMV